MAGPHGRGHGGKAHAKPKNFKKALRGLINEFMPYRGRLVIVLFLLLLSNIAVIFAPLQLQEIIKGISKGTYFYIDEVSGAPLLSQGINWTPLVIDAMLILLLIIVGTILNMIANLIAIRISGNYAYSLRQKIKEKFDRLPLSYFDKHPYGELLSIGTNDVDAISQSLNQILIEIFSALTMFVGVIIAVFILKWQLALVALTTIPLSALVTILITKNSQKQFITFQKKTGQLEGLVEENFTGLTVIKLFNQQNHEIHKFKDINTSMANSNFWSQWLSSFIFPSIRFINNLGFVGVLLVAAIVNDVAVLAAFLIFLNNFSQPFFQISQISNTIQTTLAGAERVFNLLDEKEQEVEGDNVIATSENIRGEFAFNNVSFSYAPEKELIQKMNLHVNPGDTIAIVGPTGAGKTTLVNLIMRFYEINDGEIKLDGIDLRDYSRSALRSSVGMVLQDTWLFKGSIKNNIRYGNKDATDEQVIAAAKASKAHHFISTLPGEYDFILNEDGTNISQGQRQLLTIARAIISQPKILILDEATSSVDTRTEFAIQQVMDEIMKERTTFIIAHRLSTIKNAKKIIVMHKGSIIETGNHEELLAKNGFYASLYNAQFLGIDNSVDAN